MFDKIAFANIIKNIKETYSSQEEFSKISGIGRTYLSQYMNMKLNDPPMPKILEKLSNASHNITSYEELMIICGYIVGSNSGPDGSGVNSLDDSSNKSSIFLVPVLEKIVRGQSLSSEQFLEGYLAVDPNFYGMISPDDYFYLKVSGDDMNLKVHNGDYVLIHKQDFVDDGDIVVAFVDGVDEAIVRKYSKINDELVMLEGVSTFSIKPIVVSLKGSSFSELGKAVGLFGKF